MQLGRILVDGIGRSEVAAVRDAERRLLWNVNMIMMIEGKSDKLKPEVLGRDEWEKLDRNVSCCSGDSSTSVLHVFAHRRVLAYTYITHTHTHSHIHTHTHTGARTHTH